jgi:hypothetical protein
MNRVTDMSVLDVHEVAIRLEYQVMLFLVAHLGVPRSSRWARRRPARMAGRGVASDCYSHEGQVVLST